MPLEIAKICSCTRTAESNNNESIVLSRQFVHIFLIANSGEVGYTMRKIKIYNFYSPLDRPLFLVGLKESWLDHNSRCSRFPQAHEMLEHAEDVGGWQAAACLLCLRDRVCEFSQARPQPARRSVHDITEGYGNIRLLTRRFEVQNLPISFGPSRTPSPSSSNKKVNGIYFHTDNYMYLNRVQDEFNWLDARGSTQWT